MTNAEIDRTFEKLADAIQRDDDKAGREAIIALGAVVIGSLVRVADALEHIGRNLPAR